MTWVSTGLTLESATPSGSWAVRAGDRAVLVARVGAHLYAVEDRCSHAGCAFSEDGSVDGGVLICDCHGSEFDLRTGAVARPPAREPIAAFATRVVDGVVEVDL